MMSDLATLQSREGEPKQDVPLPIERMSLQIWNLHQKMRSNRLGYAIHI